MKQFEQASGVSISYAWDTENIGKAVRQVLDGKHTLVRKQLEDLLFTAENIVKHIKEDLIKDKEDT